MDGPGCTPWFKIIYVNEVFFTIIERTKPELAKFYWYFRNYICKGFLRHNSMLNNNRASFDF